ncbi:response regulator transcription factor [Cohnella thailandensis]|uniref:Response regulator transcription factor n=1 Tax=Cohnella thailandensis TaxID=557557 RepID=A0A841T5Q0_9BACL|nr:response regulator transcription factor [Cohnella thailandensis]MBB6638186.1 response regulator transcription factor [Cohnella thailandensis]MBP1977819.1 DNA-binding response OmpR family regulator [Cohnella thailandensis]
MSRTVLVVDDDKDIVRLIADGLKYEQFEVKSAYSGAEALAVMQAAGVDFVILDIMMPGMDGLEVCRVIRERHATPILFLSARDREMDKIIGLEIGADDYMTKPFSVHELTSRVKAHFRKMERLHREWESRQEEPQSSAQVHAKGVLQLNEATYEAHLQGDKLDLSTKEFQILLYFFGRPNQVLTREQIYASVWGDDYGDMNTVTVHIKNIRKKLDSYSECIKTVWGVGYKFAPEGLRP